MLKSAYINFIEEKFMNKLMMIDDDREVLLINQKYFENEEINLSNREYELLLLLTEKPEYVVTFEDIGNAIWNIYQESDRRSIMVMMSRLRKKLERYKGLEDCIETAYGKGYSFLP